MAGRVSRRKLAAYAADRLARGDQIDDLVRELAYLCQADPQPVLQLATARPDDPVLLAGDNRRLRDTGWYPTLTLQQGLQQLVEAQP